MKINIFSTKNVWKNKFQNNFKQDFWKTKLKFGKEQKFHKNGFFENYEISVKK